ncbi:hypothetical protein [Kutzneria kofuensis]|uniref:Ribosome-associated protein YbcJ (S4-like RNA binding protein) n=1 Tax=Kutzneria kofuensis TaxID=103725 RepID=A0A7W9KDV8_9PSEU|nr:hypothetical protein [Kutzneria kofuensis]MBB5890650.1 ribosome-associated protein YbcJ (S4-like RNA binding protein) [Kutzneria kofuensis]
MFDKALDELGRAAFLKRQWLSETGGVLKEGSDGQLTEQIEEARRNATVVHGDLIDIVNELELMAGGRVVEVARTMPGTVETLHHWTRLPASSDRLDSVSRLLADTHSVRAEFVSLVRRDLNVDRFPSVRRFRLKLWQLVSWPFRHVWQPVYRWWIRRKYRAVGRS